LKAGTRQRGRETKKKGKIQGGATEKLQKTTISEEARNKTKKELQRILTLYLFEL